jgi:hypothetical protein
MEGGCEHAKASLENLSVLNAALLSSAGNQ